MRILISELSANHHETALALIAYAAALRPFLVRCILNFVPLSPPKANTISHYKLSFWAAASALWALAAAQKESL